MQCPPVKQPNLKESLKYIHPNNPYLVSFYSCKWFIINVAFQGELLEAEKQVEKTMKEYRHMLVYYTITVMCLC